MSAYWIKADKDILKCTIANLIQNSVNYNANGCVIYVVCDTDTTEQRHGLGLLIVKQIIDGHSGKALIGHSEYDGFKTVLIIAK